MFIPPITASQTKPPSIAAMSRKTLPIKPESSGPKASDRSLRLSAPPN